jgi:hypothetical protein
MPFSVPRSCSRLFGVLLPALLLAGCAMHPTPAPSADAQPTSSRYLQLVTEAPPAPKDETPPIIENPRKQVWRSGYWSYGVGGYSWVPGEVIDRPDPTAVWSPDRWVKHSFGWSFECGTWE